MVVQPQPSAVAMESYPGEVRARFDPQLAFRIGGKVTKRLVDEGERVKANQPLAELDPKTYACNWKPPARRSRPPGQPEPGAIAERDRYKTLLDRQMVSRSQFDNAENLYRAGRSQAAAAQG
jgi:membrane fusion protein, multidrug efflux system